MMATAGLLVGLARPGTVGAQDVDSLAAATEAISGKLDGLVEQMRTLQSDTDKLKKIKVSGYVQVRYDASQASEDSIRAAGFPLALTANNLDRFYIRRARVKVNWDPVERTQAVVYFDGGTDRSIRLLEAYVQMSDPWTPYQQHQLTFGQFNIPFGYEIERSSSLRELPERSRAENVLFPGERDRGIKLVDRWSDRLETVISVLNGGGIGQADFPNIDPSSAKDMTARARLGLGVVDAAVSAYVGEHAIALTGPDAPVDRTRFGADAQGYWALPRAGGGTLRGEFYTGEEANPDSVSVLLTKATAAAPVRLLKPGANASHLDTEFLGWYLMLVQNLGDRFQVAVRYDEYDRNTGVDGDEFTRWNVGVNWFYDGYTRFSLAYDVPDVSSTAAVTIPNTEDNLLTFQAQFKF
ncbi:MAG: phosphate-selective porin o and p family protein [bacterium]|nr:MAG: phosphate-selective porin o and p family protein [bacterium]